MSALDRQLEDLRAAWEAVARYTVYVDQPGKRERILATGRTWSEANALRDAEQLAISSAPGGRGFLRPIAGVRLENRNEAIAAQKARALEVTRAELPVKASALFVQRGRERFQVDSLEDASRKWDRFRDATGAGASEIGATATIVDQDGREVAMISYNGKVWPPGGWKPGVKPLVGEEFKP